MHFPRLITVTSREWIEAVAAARRQKGTKGWNQGQATHTEGEDWVTIMEGGEGGTRELAAASELASGWVY